MIIVGRRLVMRCVSAEAPRARADVLRQLNGQWRTKRWLLVDKATMARASWSPRRSLDDDGCGAAIEPSALSAIRSQNAYELDTLFETSGASPSVLASCH